MIWILLEKESPLAWKMLMESFAPLQQLFYPEWNYSWCSICTRKLPPTCQSQTSEQLSLPIAVCLIINLLCVGERISPLCPTNIWTGNRRNSSLKLHLNRNSLCFSHPTVMAFNQFANIYLYCLCSLLNCCCFKPHRLLTLFETWPRTIVDHLIWFGLYLLIKADCLLPNVS